MESGTNPCRQWYLLLTTTASIGLRQLYLWIVWLYQYLTQKFNQDRLQKWQNTWAGRESSLLKHWSLVPGALAIYSRKILSLGLFKRHVTIILCIYWVLHSYARLDNSICFFLAKRCCTLILGRRWKREIYLYTIAFWMHFKGRSWFQS